MEVVLSRSGIKWLDFVLSAPRKLNPGFDQSYISQVL